MAQLATVMAPCILRPKQESGLSMTERYNTRLMRDLFAHKQAIFGELKRQASLTNSKSGATRQTRAVSTDESRRREHMEERQRAIAASQQAQASAGGSKVRQPSPGPGNRTPAPIADGTTHRRDRSRGPVTRFPISTSTAEPPSDRRVISPTSTSSSHRDSLGVPLSPPQTRTQSSNNTTSPPKSSSSFYEVPRTNGSLHQPPPAEDDQPEFSKRTSVPPNLPASMSGPQEFMAPNHNNNNNNNNNNNSIDSTSAATMTSTGRTSLDSTKPLPTSASKYKITNADPTDLTRQRSSSPAGDGNTPVKRDSLGRSGAGTRAYPIRKGTGGLQRQSLVVGKRDSVDSNYLDTPVDAPGAFPVDNIEVAGKGVQLEDKPMDFD